MTEPTLQRLELNEVPPAAGEGAALVKRDLALIRHLSVKLSACVGEASLSVDELFALKKGQTLALAQGVDEPVLLQLDGRAVARGELVAVGDHFGVRITELL